jgi:hypothetical protein
MIRRVDKEGLTIQRIRRRATLQFDFGLPYPPRMAYSLGKNQ